jgi:hypothetical protein
MINPSALQMLLIMTASLERQERAASVARRSSDLDSLPFPRWDLVIEGREKKFLQRRYGSAEGRLR